MLFAVQCIDGASSTADRKGRVLESLALDFALAKFQTFSNRTERLYANVEAFCATPSQEGLEVAQADWKACRETQKSFEIIQFGPMKEFPLSLGPNLDTWPADPGFIEDFVKGDSELSLEAFQSAGSKRRGLPPMEYLLWSGEQSPLDALNTSTRRCDVLVGMARDAANNATILQTTWEEEWVPQLTKPTPEGEYETLQDALDEWVNRMAFTVENIRKDKLGRPAGDKADGKPQPDTLESAYSENSLTDATNALAGVALVWNGDDETGIEGISTLINDLGLRLQVNELFDRALADIQAIPTPLSETIVGDTSTLVATQNTLLEIQAVIQEDVAAQIGITLSFNDTDGD